MYMLTCKHTYVHVCDIYSNIYIYIYIYMLIHVYAYICIYIHMCAIRYRVGYSASATDIAKGCSKLQSQMTSCASSISAYTHVLVYY